MYTKDQQIQDIHLRMFVWRMRHAHYATVRNPTRPLRQGYANVRNPTPGVRNCTRIAYAVGTRCLRNTTQLYATVRRFQCESDFL